MALAETLILGASIGLCLLLAWAMAARGSVDLIAGYDGDLPPGEETELARDVGLVLVVAAGGAGLLVIDVWTEAVPRSGTLVTVTVVAPIGWLLWKWNVRNSGSTPAG